MLLRRRRRTLSRARLQPRRHEETRQGGRKHVDTSDDDRTFDAASRRPTRASRGLRHRRRRTKSPRRSCRTPANSPTTVENVANSDSVIVVKGLTKQFGQRVAFEDVTFNVRRGEVFGFLGPNGAGKTSTVRTLSTLVAPSVWHREVAGIPLDGEARHRDSSTHRGDDGGSRTVLAPERHGEPGLLRGSLRLSRRATSNRSGARVGQPLFAGQRSLRQSVQGTASTRGSGAGAPQRSGDHVPRRTNGRTWIPSRRSRCTI